MDLNFGELRFDEEAKRNVARVLERVYDAGAGPEVEAYEKEWGKLFGYQYNLAVCSGTAADTIACKTLYDLGAERGDEVIAPALAFIAVGTSILDAGFKPVFVDVERHTLNINPRAIEEKITSRTRAIMAVHTMGKPCEMDAIADIARKHNLYVIEDSCEAHGAQYRGRTIGHWGDMATFSSYVAHLICTGEGGMVSTNNKEVADLLRSLRNHGRKPGDLYFHHLRLGGNYKMHDLEAALGRAAISKFWDTFNRRKKNLRHLMDATQDLSEFAFFNIEEPHEVLCPHAFSITLKDPKFDYQGLYNYLHNNSVMSIKCKRNFGSMPTQHPLFTRKYTGLDHKLGEFPEAEYVGNNGVHFGVHQYLSQEQLEKASEVMHTYFKRFE